MKPRFYACWQRPDWFQAARKGPLERKYALYECEKRRRMRVELVWLEDEEGRKELYTGLNTL
jgi:hypothetical protein